jgi:hypothetical protein
LAAVALACLPQAAGADGGTPTYRYVTACDGTFGPLTASGPSTLTYDQHGQQCGAGGGGGGGTAGFQPAPVGSPIAVTTGGVTGTLPAGSVVVASNVGTTNIAYCALGAATTTAWQPISPNGGWFAFTVGAATQLSCITTASTTTVNMVGGSGLPTGTGGGGGGTGGGAATIIDGGDATQGAKADTACGTDAGTGCTTEQRLARIATNLTTLNTTAGAPVNNVAASGADPCFGSLKANFPISTAAGTTQLVAGVSAKKIYVCSSLVVSGGVAAVSFIEGTNSSCASPAAVVGSTTAANGIPLVANAGWQMGSGTGTVAQTANNANYLCLFQSSTAQLSGNITYVQQ